MKKIIITIISLLTSNGLVASHPLDPRTLMAPLIALQIAIEQTDSSQQHKKAQTTQLQSLQKQQKQEQKVQPRQQNNKNRKHNGGRIGQPRPGY